MSGILTFLGFFVTGRSSATGWPRRSMTITSPFSASRSNSEVRMRRSRTEAFLICYIVALRGILAPLEAPRRRRARSTNRSAPPSRLVADFDLGTGLFGGFVAARGGVAGQLQEGLAFALAEHDGAAGIAADAHLRVERQLPEEVHLHRGSRAAASAVAEDVDAFVAVRANEEAHVFDNPENRHAHLVKHVHGLAGVL